MIRLVGVTKVFGATAEPAVSDLSLDIPDGEIVILIGPSGCGKSTILKMINRLIEPTSGTIEIDGTNIVDADPHELRKGIGYVIQESGLFPHRTVSENIATIPHLLGWDRRRRGDRVAELSDLVGLESKLLDRYPGELSGGQRQRVGVARALAADPPVLLMDEPFGAVDPIVRAHLQDELLRLQRTVGKTIVLVTHDIDEAIKLGDRMAILNVGGILEQYGTPEHILRAPANDFVREFLGAELGLKRLARIKVGDIELESGPVVDASASVDEAKELMASYGVGWIGVLDGDHLRGWAWAADLDSSQPVGAAQTQRFRVWMTPSSTLRTALDHIVMSRSKVAVVFDDDDKYLGMVSLDMLSEEILR